MNNNKIYNFIFPTFISFILVPWLFLTVLIGNFVLDSIVIFVISFIIFKKVDLSFYKGTIFKVWLFGFLADIMGLIYLIIMAVFFMGDNYQGTDVLKLFASGIDLAVNHSLYDSPWSIAFVASGVFVSAVFIFVFNCCCSFKKTVLSRTQRIISSLIISIITAPYTFLLPREFFY